MRNAILLATLLALAITLGSFSEASAESLTVNVRFDVSDVIFATKTGGDGKTYTTVGVLGCHETTEAEGKPELPAKTVRILLPPRARLDSVVGVATNQVPIPRAPEYGSQIFPKQPPVPLDGTSTSDWVPPDSTVYTSAQPYPSVRVTWRREHDHIGEYACAEVTIYPVDYTPASGEIKLSTSVDVIMNYTRDSSERMRVARRSFQAQQVFSSYVAGVVENPTMLTEYDTPPVDDRAVDFVIITPPATIIPVVSPFEKLATWKTQRGVVTKVIETDWIAANFDGVDIQERIRSFIKYARENWGTIYVLLAGDTDIIPDRKAIWDGHGGIWGPTDLYYSGLDGDWNSNRNAQFGEGGDLCDDTPDIFLGRAPVRTLAEAQRFVDEIIKYEELPPVAPHALYPKSALLMGAGLEDSPWWRYWGQGIKDSIASLYLPPDWFRWKLYNPIGSGNQLLNRSNALYHLRMGYHLVNHADHCGPFDMGTGLKFNPGSERLINRLDVDRISSPNKSILFTLGCSPNAFDTDSISEHFINNPNGGCLAYIGNTRTGWSSQSYQDYKFFESIFSSTGELYHLGAAFASIQYGGSYYQRNMNLLGDPELPVWTTDARRMTIIVPECIPLRPTDVTIGVFETSEVPVDRALVCLMKKDDIYVTGLTGPDGLVRFHLKPESPGSIKVTASKHNYLLATETLPVIGTLAPALSYKAHRVDDDMGGSSIGNGDGIIDSGETIEMPIELKNMGGGTARGIRVKLISSSPYIVILSNEQTYEDIPAGQTSWSRGSFVFQVLPDAPDWVDVRFGLEITCSDSPSDIMVWRDTFDVTIHSPILSHALHRVRDDSGGDGDGILEPGETAQIPIMVRNSGRSNVNFLLARMESLSPHIEVLVDMVHFHHIGPRSDMWNCPFCFLTVHTTSEYEPGDMVRVIIWDEYGHSVSSDFDFKPIQHPENLRLRPGRGCMDLSWDVTPGAIGYHVYRKLPGEMDFQRANDAMIVTASLFHDEGLPAGILCQYRVTAVNETCNESVKGLEGANCTNPPMYGGWPQQIGSNGVSNSSPALVDLDRDGKKEIVVCATDGWVYAWKANGALFWKQSIPDNVGASPAVADIDRDGWPEIIVAADKVYIWKANGLPMPGWPRSMDGPSAGSASVGDLNGDGYPEIVATSLAAKVYAWHANGSPVAGWPVSIDDPNDWVRTTAALADVDADGLPEVIAGTLDTAYLESQVYIWNGDGTRLPYWPQPVDFVIWASPVVGDIDNDDRVEIIVGSMRRDSNPYLPAKIYVWHADGTPQEGAWPYVANYSIENAPAIANVDGGTDLEIVAGLGDGRAIVLKHNGTPLPGWPVQLEPISYAVKRAMQSPSVADLDSDGIPEIAITCSDAFGRFHILKANGQPFCGAPYATGSGMPSAPTIDEIDPVSSSTPNPEIVVGALDRLVYAWSLPIKYNLSRVEWPTFMHDYKRTGRYGPEPGGPPVPIKNINTVKLYADGAFVKLTGKIVTAAPREFESAIYIEEPDRSSGIRVHPTAVGILPITRWQSVDVAGRLVTIEGERVLVDAAVTPGILNIILNPVGMGNKTLGGGPLGKFTPGVYPEGVGTNNIGLLVQTYGRVTWVSPEGDRFYIDDGSKLRDGSGHVGVWVSLTGLAEGNIINPPPVGSYVTVVGISSCGYGPLEPLVRILRPRCQDDIRVVADPTE